MHTPEEITIKVPAPIFKGEPTKVTVPADKMISVHQPAMARCTPDLDTSRAQFADVLRKQQDDAAA